MQLECVKKQELTLADCVNRRTVAEKASAECIFFFDKVSLIILLIKLDAIRQLAGEHDVSLPGQLTSLSHTFDSRVPAQGSSRFHSTGVVVTV